MGMSVFTLISIDREDMMCDLLELLGFMRYGNMG